MSDSSGSTTSGSSEPGSPFEAAFMGVVLLVMFGCLFTGWKTPETVVFLCLVLVWNVGLVGTTEALSGFSNAGMLAVGALFVVIKGVEKSQLADKAARQVFGLRTSLSAGLARMMCLCFVLSAFLNNTPVVALLIPITRDWARARGFSPSTFLIPLSYSCIMGGLLTVIGTSTNLVVQGLVLVEAQTDPTIERIRFFEPAYVGVPLGVIGMAYLVVFAPRVLPSCGGLFRYVRDRAKELLTEVQVMDEFPYIGEPAGLVLVRLGLPQDTLIKIRRRIPSGILRQMSASLEGNASLLLPPGAPPTEGGGGGTGVDANALMEANQKTLRAEGMYSYRQRAECLWGTTEDMDSAAEEKSLTPAPRAPRRSGSFIRRKRWASDADAADLATAKNRGRAATVGSAAVAPENCIAYASANANVDANGNATASVNGAGGDKGGGIGDGTANASSIESSDGETYTDIFPVSPAEPVQAGDVLFLSCAQATMIDFQSVTVSQGLKGLKFLDVSALDLPGHGTEFFEIVLSDHNHFVGRSADRDNSEFAAYYGCSVVAVRRRGRSGAVAPSAASVPAAASRGCGGGADATGGGGGGGGGGDGGGWTPSAAPFKGSSRVTDAAEVFIEEGLSAEPAFDSNSGPPTPVSLASGKTSTKLPSAAAAAAGRSDVTTPPRGTRSAVRAMRSPLRSLRKEVDAQDGDDVTGLSFKAGDVVLVLAKEEFMEKYAPSKDFFLLTKVGSVPKPVRYYDYLPLLAFLGMLCWVLFDQGTDMVQAAFAAGAVLILGGWVDAKKTVGYIDWSLLLLIGSALGLSKGIVNSGLAGYVGRAIRDSGISPDVSLFVLYAFTMTCTELITNNAAAALATPIAFNIARELDVSYKPFIITVMLAASSSFITPIGYQTNTLVWGPGGYRFTDFMKIGTPLSLIYLVLGCLLVPRVFPF